MKVCSWNNNLLEPVIITFNRADLLRQTLAAFYEAGLSCIRMHVLDNASTDNTRQVVAEYADSWPTLIYHKNTYNIGGNANILRAIELSSSVYCWVIRDDDEWHLEDLTELISVLENGTVDIIRLGWLVSDKSRGQVKSLLELVNEENNLFASLSMISATVAKRDLLVRYLRNSYSNIGQFYPQLVPFIMCLNDDGATVYSVGKNLVVHTPSQEPGYYNNDLEWYSHWFSTSRFFMDDDFRTKFNEEVLVYRTSSISKVRHFLHLLKVALNAKAKGLSQGIYITSMLLVGKGHRFLLSSLFIAYLVAPSCFLKLLRYCFKGTKYIPVRDVSRL